MKTKLPGPIYTTIAGFSLFAISICLTRFAYGPLVPSLIDTHWLTKTEAGYLGAFNGFGYIIGCLIALWLPRITGIRLLMRSSLVLAVIGIGMCSWNFGFAWLSLGRFLAGFSAAALMIHSTALLMKNFQEKTKDLFLGFAISGGGLTIVIICLVLPFFITNGPSGGWLLEAIITLLFTAIAWPFISMAPHQREPSSHSIQALVPKRKRLVLLTTIAYSLMSVGAVPHTLFLADYMHRDLGLSISDSITLFAIFGLGFTVGAMYVGMLIRLFGTRLSLCISYTIGVTAIAMVLLSDSVIIVASSSFLIGVFLSGTAGLSSIRTLEAVGLSRHPHFWGFMTLGFGVGMAAGSYSMSALLSLGFNYIDLFKIAQVTLIIALGIIIFSSWRYRNIEDSTSSI